MFTLDEEVPDTETYMSLRSGSGMRARSNEGAEKGLGRELFSVVLRLEETGEPVGMGRVIGDGGTIFVICDMAVLDSWQRMGGGTMIMDALMDFILRESPPRSYVNLMADVDGFYERWGFVPSLPNSRGMVFRVPPDCF